MPRNGPETAGSVKARVKLARPTLTCQPCGSVLPSASTNEPDVVVGRPDVAGRRIGDAVARFVVGPRRACLRTPGSAPGDLIAPFSVGTKKVSSSSDRAPTCPAFSRIQASGAAVTLPRSSEVGVRQGRETLGVAAAGRSSSSGSTSRNTRSPVAGSPSAAMVRTYSVEPSTCWTEPARSAAIASSLVPRWPSPKLVKAVVDREDDRDDLEDDQEDRARHEVLDRDVATAGGR